MPCTDSSSLNQATVLMIGGGASQLPYAQTLREWGCRLLLTDRDAQAPSRALADDHAVASTLDAEQTLQVIRERGWDRHITHVFSATTGAALATVSSVVAELGLPAPVRGRIEDLLDKARLRAVLNRCAARALRFACADNLLEAQRAAREVGFPCYLKPALGGMGGRGVSRVERQEQVEAAFVAASMSGATDHVLIEQAVDGIEYGVTLLLHDGRTHFFDAGRALKAGPVPTGRVMGGGDHPQDGIRAAVESACAQLGVMSTPVNLDVIVDAQGHAHILELEFALADALQLAPLAYGYDLLENSLRCYLRQPPQAQPGADGAAALFYFVRSRPGQQPAEDVGMLKAEADILELDLDEAPRVQWGEREEGLCAQGHVLLRCRSQHEAAQRVYRLNQRLGFITGEAA